MTTKFDETYYEEKILQHDWDDLLNLWQSIEKGNPLGWQPRRALEYLILRAFQLEGATIHWPYSVDLDDEMKKSNRLTGQFTQMDFTV